MAEVRDHKLVDRQQQNQKQSGINKYLDAIDKQKDSDDFRTNPKFSGIQKLQFETLRATKV